MKSMINVALDTKRESNLLRLFESSRVTPISFNHVTDCFPLSFQLSGEDDQIFVKEVFSGCVRYQALIKVLLHSLIIIILLTYMKIKTARFMHVVTS